MMSEAEALAFGKKIRIRRTELGISQQDLAERLFVTRQSVSNYERGNLPENPKIIEMICRELGMVFPENDPAAEETALDSRHTDKGGRAADSNIGRINLKCLLFPYGPILLLLFVSWVFAFHTWPSISGVIDVNGIEFRYTGSLPEDLSLYLIRPAAAFLTGWFVITLLRRLGILRLSVFTGMKKQLIFILCSMLLTVLLLNLINELPVIIWDLRIELASSGLPDMYRYCFYHERSVLVPGKASDLLSGFIRYFWPLYLFSGALFALCMKGRSEKNVG